MKTRRTFLKFIAGIIPLSLIPESGIASIDIPAVDWIENPRWKDPKFRVDSGNLHSKMIHQITKFNMHVKEYESGWERYLGKRFTVHRTFELGADNGTIERGTNMWLMAFCLGNFESKEKAISFANRFLE